MATASASSNTLKRPNTIIDDKAEDEHAGLAKRVRSIFHLSWWDEGFAFDRTPPETRWLDTVKVTIGKDKLSFTIHHDLLTARSDFFREACSEKWVQAGRKTIHLPERRDGPMNDMNYFKLFVKWLYAPLQSLMKIIDAEANAMSRFHVQDDETPWREDNHRIHLIISLWLLADYLGVMELKREATDCTFAVQRMCAIWPEEANLIWHRTKEHSGLRLWLVDYMATNVTQSDLRQDGSEYPPELILQLLQRFVPPQVGQAVAINPRPKWEDRCKYHEHKEGESCAGEE